MKKRLDDILVARGLAATRSRARDFIRRGHVRAGDLVATKAGLLVEEAADIIVAPEAGAAYVSRGALKLIAALDQFGFDPRDRIALDAGASTGGFTEVLLQRGAARIFAVDVGKAQLHPTLRRHPNVTVLEERDVRDLGPDDVPGPVGALTADVSFISVTRILPALMGLAASGAWLVVLVKPQFEVGPSHVGKGGIVRDATLQTAAVENVARAIEREPGWQVTGMIPSPIAGGSGNVEYLIGATFHV